MPDPIIVTLKRQKDTKNTVRFEEIEREDAALAVGTLYVQKHAVKALGNPETITLTIQSA